MDERELTERNTILVVDDTPANLQLLAALLKDPDPKVRLAAALGLLEQGLQFSLFEPDPGAARADVQRDISQRGGLD